MELSTEAAERFLIPAGRPRVIRISHISNMNDVFRAETESHGSFYFKFHTADWYQHVADTLRVVQGELSAITILRKAGLRMDFDAWADYTGIVDGWSVLITSELRGKPFSSCLESEAESRNALIAAFGLYLASIHSITFKKAGGIAPSHAYFYTRGSVLREANTDNAHRCTNPAVFVDYYLELVEYHKRTFGKEIIDALHYLLEENREGLFSSYETPVFVVNNFHPFHFFAQPENGSWRITGLVDLEAACAGNPIHDLVSNEIQLLPILKSYKWRKIFFESYNAMPAFEAFKLVLLGSLMNQLRTDYLHAIPDRRWLINKFPALVSATDFAMLRWYPVPGPGTGKYRENNSNRTRYNISVEQTPSRLSEKSVAE